MSMNISNFMKAIVLSLICAVAFSIPTYAAQGNGKGKGNGRGRIDVVRRDSTPGVPTSPLGRGRNYNPGTPRGRYIRSTTLIRNGNRRFTTPRKVKRGRYITPGTRRGSIY
jgi:hypothetical protein